MCVCWDFIQIWFDNKMFSSQWDNDNQHFVYIIFSWYLLGIITRQGFLFSCSCMNRCTCPSWTTYFTWCDTYHVEMLVLILPLSQLGSVCSVIPHYSDDTWASCIKSWQLDSLFHSLFRLTIKKTLKLCITSSMLEEPISDWQFSSQSNYLIWQCKHHLSMAFSHKVLVMLFICCYIE